MRIRITGNIIKASRLLVEGRQYSACHCPVAIALNMQTDFSGWFVGNDEAICLASDNRFPLPKRAAKFLKDFENGNKVEPFSFVAPDAQSRLPAELFGGTPASGRRHTTMAGKLRLHGPRGRGTGK